MLVFIVSLVMCFSGLNHGDDRESIDRANMKLPNGQYEIIAKLLEATAKRSPF